MKNNVDKNIWSGENLKRIIASVHHFSATDMEFRRLCLKSPKQAVEKIAGHKIPENITISFVESDPKADLTYLLPDFITRDELTDTELSQVSGGRGNPIPDILKKVEKPITDAAEKVKKELEKQYNAEMNKQR